MKHQYERYIKFLDEQRAKWEELLVTGTPADFAVLSRKNIQIVIKQNLANEATLERHKSKQLGPIKYPNGTLYCSECFTDQGHDGAFPVPFPCPSLLDVTNQLDLVMGVSND